MNYFFPKFENKILRPEEIVKNLSRIHYSLPLVFTNGCFDILHRGHVTYLAQARELGGSMIVAVNSDDSVKRQNKGVDRPINKLEDRMAVLASLESVNFVTYFEEDTPLNLILKINPNILVKGGDWDIKNIVGSNEVLANGGAVYSIPFLFDTSTSKVIYKIRHE